MLLPGTQVFCELINVQSARPARQQVNFQNGGLPLINSDNLIALAILSITIAKCIEASLIIVIYFLSSFH